MRLDSVLYRRRATDFRFLLREEVVEGEASSKGDDEGALDKVSVCVSTFTVCTCTLCKSCVLCSVHFSCVYTVHIQCMCTLHMQM